jgi:hypothetical protein
LTNSILCGILYVKGDDTMSRKEVLENLKAIERSKDKIFSCHFIKRTDGSYRKMVARLHVRKGVKGVGMAYNPAEKDLVTVFDMQKNNFRSIPLDSIRYLKVLGEEIIK